MLHAIPRRLHSILMFGIVALALTACSGDSNPTAPTPQPSTPPTPQTISVSGYVGNQSNGAGIGGATVRASHNGATTTSGGDGFYSLDNLPTGSFSITASAGGFNSRTRSVNAQASQRVDLELIPFFSRSGRGNTVFDMPTAAQMRVRIQGRWDRRDTSNFIVRIGGRLVVNEILRSTITYDGVHLTNGGVVEITNSNNIDWTFTQEQ